MLGTIWVPEHACYSSGAVRSMVDWTEAAGPVARSIEDRVWALLAADEMAQAESRQDSPHPPHPTSDSNSPTTPLPCHRQDCLERQEPARCPGSWGGASAGAGYRRHLAVTALRTGCESILSLGKLKINLGKLKIAHYLVEKPYLAG